MFVWLYSFHTMKILHPKHILYLFKLSLSFSFLPSITYNHKTLIKYRFACKNISTMGGWAYINWYVRFFVQFSFFFYIMLPLSVQFNGSMGSTKWYKFFRRARGRRHFFLLFGIIVIYFFNFVNKLAWETWSRD